MEFVVAGAVLLLLLCLLFFLGLGRLKHNRRKRQIDDILIPYKPMFEDKTPDFIISLDPEDQVPIPDEWTKWTKGGVDVKATLIHDDTPGRESNGAILINQNGVAVFKPKKPAVKMSEQEKRDLNRRRERAASFLEGTDGKTLAILRGGPEAGKTMILEGSNAPDINVAIMNPVSFSEVAFDLDAVTTQTGRYQRTNKVDSQLRRVYQWKAPKKRK